MHWIRKIVGIPKKNDACKRWVISGRKGFGIIRKASSTLRQVAKAVTDCAADKKAEDIVVLDMRNVANFCEYFVLCSGNSNRHVRAIADGIDEGLEKIGRRPHKKQGHKTSDWIVFDLGDVVIHIFYKPLREFYQLDYLWKDAKIVNLKEKKIKKSDS